MRDNKCLGKMTKIVYKHQICLLYEQRLDVSTTYVHLIRGLPLLFALVFRLAFEVPNRV